MTQHLNTSTLTSWLKNDDIDGGLAADFDGSLSGLGVELGTSTYNMSEALMALPVFKQETLDNSFQYLLGAPTSPAQKMNEETLTYLNQGQSYEIKLKKLGDTAAWKNKIVESTIRVVFHERRLQFMENEQLDLWQKMRPGERLVDLDVPLSYGILDATVDPRKLNELQVVWDPSKDTGVYVKVHCISTEFTPKKHGGEKGVPFRVQVQTFTHGEGEEKLLHCASSQIKVFKPKGADRKQKTDREKMEKRPESEKGKYQPSYDCTVLSEVAVDEVLNQTCSAPPAASNASQNLVFEPPSPAPSSTSTSVLTPGSPNDSQDTVPATEINDMENVDPLSPNADAKQVAAWLQTNRFTQFIKIFQNFSGADLLRLTKDDLIQICGLADGIRLNNALQSRAVRPRLTLYVCQDSPDIFHAIYLETLTSEDLVQKIATLFRINITQIPELYVIGPEGIHIHINNQVVQNIQDESRFIIEAQHRDSAPDQYTILLKTIP